MADIFIIMKRCSPRLPTIRPTPVSFPGRIVGSLGLHLFIIMKISANYNPFHNRSAVVSGTKRALGMIPAFSGTRYTGDTVTYPRRALPAQNLRTENPLQVPKDSGTRVRPW